MPGVNVGLVVGASVASGSTVGDGVCAMAEVANASVSVALRMIMVLGNLLAIAALAIYLTVVCTRLKILLTKHCFHGGGR